MLLGDFRTNLAASLCRTARRFPSRTGMSRSLLQQCGDRATLVLLELRHTGRGESGEWLYKTKYMSLRREQLSGAHGEPSLAPRSLRIVVADDDRDTVLTLMLLLREEGHDVRGVHSSTL